MKVCETKQAAAALPFANTPKPSTLQVPTQALFLSSTLSHRPRFSAFVSFLPQKKGIRQTPSLLAGLGKGFLCANSDVGESAGSCLFNRASSSGANRGGGARGEEKGAGMRIGGGKKWESNSQFWSSSSSSFALLSPKRWILAPGRRGSSGGDLEGQHAGKAISSLFSRTCALAKK